MYKKFVGSPKFLPAVIIVAAFFVVIGIGASALIYRSALSPVYIGAVPYIVTIFILTFRRPVWALYAAVFSVLLPIGLISDNLQSYLNRIIAVVALAAWLVNWIINRRKIFFPVSSGVMAAFIVWGSISLFWAASLKLGLQDTQTYVLRFVVFLLLLTSEIKTKSNLNTLMKILALNGWIYALSGLYSLFSQGYEAGSRLQIFSENENTTASILLVTSLGVLWNALRPSKKLAVFNKIAAVVFIAITIALTGFSGSRGGAISLAVALLLFLLFRSTRSYGMLGMLIILCGLLIAPFVFNTTIERFISSDHGTTLGGREILWDAAWRVIVDRPILGVGIGNSGLAISPYLNIVLTQSTNPPSLHNPILTIWSELGPIGLVLYMGIMVSAIWSFIRSYILSKTKNITWLLPYFPLTFAVFIGYMLSWIKGGGMELAFSYFLLLGMLNIPSVVLHLDVSANNNSLRS
jgi:O-antigen ligase